MRNGKCQDPRYVGLRLQRDSRKRESTFQSYQLTHFSSPPLSSYHFVSARLDFIFDQYLICMKEMKKCTGRGRQSSLDEDCSRENNSACGHQSIKIRECLADASHEQMAAGQCQQSVSNQITEFTDQSVEGWPAQIPL